MDNTYEEDSAGSYDPKSDSQYIQFKCLPPGEALNRWSHFITREHDFPGAQAMLYGAGVPNENMMKNAAQVGIATVWWEGNPCNTHREYRIGNDPFHNFVQADPRQCSTSAR